MSVLVQGHEGLQTFSLSVCFSGGFKWVQKPRHTEMLIFLLHSVAEP